MPAFPFADRPPPSPCLLSCSCRPGLPVLGCRAETPQGCRRGWGCRLFLLLLRVCFFSLNNTNIHFKESKRKLPCAVPANSFLSDLHVPPPPKTPVLGACTHRRW